MKPGTAENQGYSSLSEKAIELLSFRSKIPLSDQDLSTKNICLHHQVYFLRKFSSYVSKNCSNIFALHIGKKPKGTREIS